MGGWTGVILRMRRTIPVGDTAGGAVTVIKASSTLLGRNTADVETIAMLYVPAPTRPSPASGRANHRSFAEPLAGLSSTGAADDGGDVLVDVGVGVDTVSWSMMVGSRPL